MQKEAIIIVGSHDVGKSHFIRNILKPKLNMSTNQRITKLNSHNVYIKSQTIQEAHTDLSALNKLMKYDFLVLPSWPNSLHQPSLDEVCTELKNLGFRVTEMILPEQTASERLDQLALDIYDIVYRK